MGSALSPTLMSDNKTTENIHNAHTNNTDILAGLIARQMRISIRLLLIQRVATKKSVQKRAKEYLDKCKRDLDELAALLGSEADMEPATNIKVRTRLDYISQVTDMAERTLDSVVAMVQSDAGVPRLPS